jgi:chondroitin AC lyase
VDVSTYRKDELTEIIRLRKGEIKPNSSFSTFFWQSEHFAFQRPEFYTSVRMYSVRNRNMEVPYNSEGLKNHHKGDGANFLSKSGKEYLNIWPVYDWQRIPGSTVVQKPGIPPSNEVQKDGVTTFVGAVSDGLYGAVGFDFISPHDGTQARKSWFFFDEEYLCLGAGIESTSRFPVATTLNQTLLNGEVIVADQAKIAPIKAGEHAIEEAKWILHDGVGYIFPEPENLGLTNKEESGSWYEINQQWDSPRDTVSKKVFKLWIDHGIRPQGRQGGLNHTPMKVQDVTYQYIVVPTADRKELSRSRPLKILSNTRWIQAVKHLDLDIVQVIFYRAGSLAVSENVTITLDTPGALMIKWNDGVVEQISVADPSRTIGRLHMRISGLMEEQQTEKVKILPDQTSNSTELEFDLPKGHFAGQSVTVEL